MKVNVTYKVKDAIGIHSTTKVCEPEEAGVTQFAAEVLDVMLRELQAKGVDVLMATMRFSVECEVLVGIEPRSMDALKVTP